ncbi:MAG: integration host factor subunit beta [Spirochaetales bacterium]|nr:integration host factor subunit beta [Spirochaetales bacterium]
MDKEKLTKAEIIKDIYEAMDPERGRLNRDDIHQILDLFFEEIKNGLVEGKTIELRNLGTFEVRTRKGKEKARNPKTGATVSTDDHNVAYFRPGQELKRLLWDQKND